MKPTKTKNIQKWCGNNYPYWNEIPWCLFAIYKLTKNKLYVFISKFAIPINTLKKLSKGASTNKAK